MSTQYMNRKSTKEWRTLVKLLVASVMLAVLTPLSAAADGDDVTSKTITLDGDTAWVVSAEEPEPLQLALRDVARDWYKVLGRRPIILNEPPKDLDLPVIYFGSRAPWLKNLEQEKYSGPESFVLRTVTDDRGKPALLAAGADMRGSIYAAYTVSEELLGVDPWYYWVDKEPKYKGSVEIAVDYHKAYGTPTFKYRGWFLNDEDLLAHFAPDPMGENIMSLTMIDRICETLLRLRANMLVPGTFTFPDEKSQVLLSRRGLVTSQHHMNVVGTNPWRWPDNLPYDYDAHPEIMEKVWQKCIDVLKDRETAWIVGYRGKWDSPFWRENPRFKSDKARGAMISKVIAKQVEMVRAVQPDAEFFWPCWSEGTLLYTEGCIRLPEGVSCMWADDWRRIGMVLDGGKAQPGDGLYYHTGLMGNANQLTELVPPSRIHREMGRIIKAKATKYFLLNVGDIRHTLLSTDYAMRLARDASTELDKSSPQAQSDFLLDWSERQFGAEVAGQVAEIRRDYFATDYMQNYLGENHFFMCYYDSLINAIRDVTPDQNIPVQARMIGRRRRIISSDEILAQMRKIVKSTTDSLCHLVPLAERAEALKSKIPADRRDFYQSHVLTQIAIHRHGNGMIQKLAEAILDVGKEKNQQTIKHLEKCLGEYEAYVAAMRKAEYGHWRGWYDGDSVLDVFQIHNEVKRLHARLTGAPLPPPRVAANISQAGDIYRAYRDMYRYQERLLQNFPLLYPSDPPSCKEFGLERFIPRKPF